MGTSTAPPLSVDELARHMHAMVPDLRQFPLKRLEREVHIGCVDGRHTGCVAGAPGGNAGLLIILLAAWERLYGPLRPDQVETLFLQYLNRFGTFYLHTDETAQAALAEWLGLEGYAPADVDALVLNPPPALRERFLEGLLMPEHTGCGHLRLMMTQPERYEIRHDLILNVLRAFFRTLWRGDARLVFDILQGRHEERGVIRMHVHDAEDSGLTPDSPFISACPHHRDVEVFVYHPNAVAYLQEQQVHFLHDLQWIDSSDVPLLHETQAALQELHLSSTLQTLAGHLPVFDVHVRTNAEAQASAVEILNA